MAKKPTAASILLLLGGLVTIIAGLLLIAIPYFSASNGLRPVVFPASFVFAVSLSGGLGVISGLILIFSGIMIYRNTSNAKMWPKITLLFTLISLSNFYVFSLYIPGYVVLGQSVYVTFLTNFLNNMGISEPAMIGFILSLVGSILSLKFKQQ